jgi:hypothetical protein
MATFNVNLEGMEYDSMDAGLRLDPGWYRAILDDCYDDSKSADTVMVWKVTHGSSKGAKHSDRLRDPELATSDVGKNMAIKRIVALGKRFGLIAPEDKSMKPINFQDVIGFEGVIHIVERGYTDKAGLPAKSIEVDFVGVYSLNHDKIPPAVRVSLGLPLLPGQSLEAPATTNGARARKTAAGPAAPAAATVSAAVDVSDL